MKMRLVVFSIVWIAMLSACDSSRRERTEEPPAQEQVIETAEEPREPQSYKEPDGAFGAKDFASEAKELSDRDTQALEEAAAAGEEEPTQDDE